MHISPATDEYRCYAEEGCSSDNSSPAAVTTFLANGESVCCNGSFSSWILVDADSNQNRPCNLCPTQGKHLLEKFDYQKLDIDRPINVIITDWLSQML